MTNRGYNIRANILMAVIVIAIIAVVFLILNNY